MIDIDIVIRLESFDFCSLDMAPSNAAEIAVLMVRAARTIKELRAQKINDGEYYQRAPFPTILAELVKNSKYRPEWRVNLYADFDRGQGSRGTTLVIQTCGYDTYNPCQGQNYRVNHYMPVPPAAYDERSWRRWLLEQFLLVERHECMEFFKIGKKRPYAPHHGPGNDCYNVFDHGEALDTRTMYTGKVLDPKTSFGPAIVYVDPGEVGAEVAKQLHPDADIVRRMKPVDSKDDFHD